MDNSSSAERWLAVPGYEGFYEVSDAGRVRSIDREFIRADGQRQFRRGRMLRPTLSGHGYPSVGLRHGVRRSVHGLVCVAFIGPRPGPDFEVAHYNGNPTDNRLENLRWATRVENQQDSVRHGTKYRPPVGVMAGEGNHNAALTWEQVEEIRSRWDSGAASQRTLAAEYGVSKSQIHNITGRKQWTNRAEWAA